jgi:hypothetical protein
MRGNSIDNLNLNQEPDNRLFEMVNMAAEAAEASEISTIFKKMRILRRISVFTSRLQNSTFTCKYTTSIPILVEFAWRLIKHFMKLAISWTNGAVANVLSQKCK